MTTPLTDALLEAQPKKSFIPTDPVARARWHAEQRERSIAAAAWRKGYFAGICGAAEALIEGNPRMRDIFTLLFRPEVKNGD